MAFDFDAAIAKLAMNGDYLDAGTSMEALTARYPELDFIFHKLEDQAATLEGCVPGSELEDVKRERDRLESAVTELTIRWQQASAMLGVMLKMDAAKGLRPELTQLAKFASDAVMYGEMVE